jgi:hypothetical protein
MAAIIAGPNLSRRTPALHRNRLFGQHIGNVGRLGDKRIAKMPENKTNPEIRHCPL